MRRGFLLSLVLSAVVSAQALPDPHPTSVIESVLAPDLLPQQVGDQLAPAGFDFGTCNSEYINRLNYQVFANQKGFELLDDLHTVAHGVEELCAYEIGFYNLSGNETSAFITIYDNDAADGAPGSILAGPFMIIGLPGGAVRAQYLAPSGVIDEDVWMGVKFGAFKGTGLTLADPVQRGVSHDVAYDPRVGYVNFGPDGLPANFVLSVSSQVPVPTNTSTWGFLKASYR